MAVWHAFCFFPFVAVVVAVVSPFNLQPSTFTLLRPAPPLLSPPSVFATTLNERFLRFLLPFWGRRERGQAPHP
jgi:hypothetical protein